MCFLLTGREPWLGQKRDLSVEAVLNHEPWASVWKGSSLKCVGFWVAGGLPTWGWDGPRSYCRKKRRKCPWRFLPALQFCLVGVGKGDGDLKECDISLPLGRDGANSLILGCYIYCTKALRPLPAPICRRKTKTSLACSPSSTINLPLKLQREEVAMRQKCPPLPSWQLTLHSVPIPTELSLSPFLLPCGQY